MVKDCGLTLGDVLPLVFRFLVKHGYNDAAGALQADASFDLSLAVG